MKADSFPEFGKIAFKRRSGLFFNRPQGYDEKRLNILLC